MTVPAPRVRRRASAPGRLLPLLLVAALLAPLGLLVAQTTGHTGDDRDLAARERLGVRYLRALAPVTDALVDAQSAAVAGRPVSRATLTAAVEQAAAVDSAVGDRLRSRQRWAGLRARIEALPERGLDPEAAYLAYGEVADLLLALHRKVRESAGLIRDPQADSFFLQDGVGGDLPAAVVAAGRLDDLATLAARRPAAERPATVAELAGLRAGALGPATGLVADLRAAVDSSESTDLGAQVLTPLDTYQRAVEALARHSTPTGPAGVEPTQLSAARFTAQAAARQLQSVILDQLDTLLLGRLGRLDRERWLAVAAAGVAAALLAGLAGVLLAPPRPARRAGDEHAERQPEASPASGTGPGTGARHPAGASREPERWGAFDAAR